MLTVGNPAPTFSVTDADMHLVELDEFRDQKNVVLYFYPRDDTPGCTVEAIEFTNLVDEFAELDTVILGVSKDDCDSHAAFRDKHGLSVRLLADTEGELCNKYGVWQEKEKDGVKKWGIVRATFVIDKHGVVQHAEYGVNARGHAAGILKIVSGLVAKR